MIGNIKYQNVGALDNLIKLNVVFKIWSGSGKNSRVYYNLY